MYRSTLKLLNTSKLLIKTNTLSQNKYAIYRFSFKSQNSNSDSTQFPSGVVDSELNWQLAKALITPIKCVFKNKAQIGPRANGNKTIVTVVGKGGFDAAKFTELHSNLAESISQRNIYVEDGELEGLHVRVVCDNENLAENVRGLLSRVEDEEFKNNVIVILGEDKELKELTIVDVKNNLVLSSSVSEESLSEAIRIIFDKKL